MAKICTDCKHILPYPPGGVEYARCGVKRQDYSSNAPSSFAFCSIVNRSGLCSKFEHKDPSKCPPPPEGPLKKLWDILGVNS
jgi:hypothetical protein